MSVCGECHLHFTRRGGGARRGDGEDDFWYVVKSGEQKARPWRIELPLISSHQLTLSSPTRPDPTLDIDEEVDPPLSFRPPPPVAVPSSTNPLDPIVTVAFDMDTVAGRLLIEVMFTLFSLKGSRTPRRAPTPWSVGSIRMEVREPSATRHQDGDGEPQTLFFSSSSSPRSAIRVEDDGDARSAGGGGAAVRSRSTENLPAYKLLRFCRHPSLLELRALQSSSTTWGHAAESALNLEGTAAWRRTAERAAEEETESMSSGKRTS